MNYIELLTQEEKLILCEFITGRNFKELFIKNEKEFTKIRKGFRAKSLTEQYALSIAKSNVAKPFVAEWINIMVDIWIRDIQENIENLEKEGSTHDIAVASTMIDSVFANNVDLYFKLVGKFLDADALSKLHEKMENIRYEREKKAVIDAHIKNAEKEKLDLLNQIKTAQQSVDTIKAEYDQKVQKIEQEKEQLKSLLIEAQERIAELQTVPTAVLSDDAKYLASFDDTNTSILPCINSDEIVSLCRVKLDYNGQKWLIRYADLNHNGCYQIFHRNENDPPYFKNRDKIFYKDGPSEDGFYGIWSWSAIPNEKDPSKDYILSHYNKLPDIIEVVTVPNSEASSLDDLINLLKNGIEHRFQSSKVMFTICISEGQYAGVLCKTKDLNIVNGMAIFAEDFIEAPVYEFTSDDILHLDNGFSFYGNAFVGIPNKLYYLKTPLDIARDAVLSSITWATYKTRNVIRSEYRTFKDLLTGIPVDDITRKIQTACRCSNPAAKNLLDEFLKVVWKYVDGDSLEDKIVLSAISANIELQEKTKALIRKDWETENERLLTEAKKELDFLKFELSSAKTSLTEAQETLQKKQLLTAEKEKLAEDVEKAVANKIQKAQMNAADFIANMAFIGGQAIHTAETEPSDATEVFSKPVIATYHTFSTFENLDELESHHSWADVINTAAYELGEAGVAEKYRNGLAAFLCAAYIEKQPILLVGPNAIDISQAFSASVIGHRHGVLCCEGNYSNQAIAEIGAKDEDIVIINNLFASGWINRLPEILSQNNIFYVVTHPYTEDIQVEPKSLYGFMLPLFSEFFVDKKATGKYYGGYFANDFKPYSASKDAHGEFRALSKLTLSPIVRSQINRLVATMHNIYSAATVDDEFLFAVLPIAYASLSFNKLTEMITDPEKGIAISASLKRDLKHFLGEF